MGALTDDGTETGQGVSRRATRIVTMEEVQKHNTATDCWLVVDDNVYDVSKFIPYHPGGKILSRYGGLDATDAFYAFHGEEPGSPGITALPRYHVGKLDKPIQIPAHLKAFRELRKQVAKEGLMKSDKLWFSTVLACYMAVYATAIFMLYMLPRSWITTVISAALMGVCWGQGGLLQHDLGHAAVFFDCKTNYLAHILFYTLFMGGSADWWKGRHTRHHASPNHNDLDLDIRTLPLFAWDKKQFKKANPSLVKWQWLYWAFLGPPILLLLYRVLNTMWMIQRRNWRETAAVVVHFVALPAIVWPAFKGDFAQCFVWFVLVLAWGGAYLGWVFALNHYMFPIYRESDERDWFTATLTTTQNVTPSFFIDHLTGHLDYQVEHHLWPRMPRHNYEKVHPRLKAICDKHGITFHESGIIDALGQVISTLINATKPEIPPVSSEDLQTHANGRKSIKVAH